jgi:hypothetical protein
MSKLYQLELTVISINSFVYTFFHKLPNIQLEMMFFCNFIIVHTLYNRYHANQIQLACH